MYFLSYCSIDFAIYTKFWFDFFEWISWFQTDFTAALKLFWRFGPTSLFKKTCISYSLFLLIPLTHWMPDTIFGPIKLWIFSLFYCGSQCPKCVVTKQLYDLFEFCCSDQTKIESQSKSKAKFPRNTHIKITLVTQIFSLKRKFNCNNATNNDI